MARAAAVYYDGVVLDDGRFLSFGAGRRAVRFIATHLMLAAAALAAVGAFIGIATVVAAWLVNGSQSGVGQGRVQSLFAPHSIAYGGPATLALAYDAAPTDAPVTAFEKKWARSTGGRPRLVAVPQDRVVREVASAGYFAPVAKLVPVAAPPAAVDFAANPVSEWTAGTPLLGRLPGPQAAAPSPANAPDVLPKAKPVDHKTVAIVVPPTPAPNKPVSAPPVHNKIAALPEADNRTAVYDIAAHTVYLPDGQKLEAHSGLYDKLDDPRYVKVKMRGPTPPNVYDLTLREALFHGVRAIRLNPVDESKMHGRDGMLAHTYMLGPNGQSNGCVSFKDYRKFLQAFLDGKINRLVVVPELGNTPWRTAARQGGVRGGAGRRYAANSEPAEGNAITRFFSTW